MEAAVAAVSSEADGIFISEEEDKNSTEGFFFFLSRQRGVTVTDLMCLLECNRQTLLPNPLRRYTSSFQSLSMGSLPDGLD